MVGFEMQTVAITSDSPLNIKMKEATEALDEVVVVSTGYTRLPKERATGSFSVVTAKGIRKTSQPEYHESFGRCCSGGLRGCQEFGYDFLYGSDRSDGYVDEQTNISMNIRGKVLF